MQPTMSQSSSNPQYNQLQEGSKSNQAQPEINYKKDQDQNQEGPQYNQLQVIIVQPVQGALGTDIGNILSKQQFMKSTYESMQNCCCCTFRFWALFGWILSLIIIIIGCIVAAVFVFLTDVIFVACKDITSDADTDTNNTTDDVNKACGLPLMISCIVLAVCVIELICVSVIIHGIRKYNYYICMFATILSGLNAFGSFGAVRYSTQSSIVGFGFFLTFSIINALHTYYVAKSNDIWRVRVETKEMIINSE